MQLTYDTRRALRVEINKARRARLGACNDCGTRHGLKQPCPVGRLDLTGYPVRERWQPDELMHFLRLACTVVGERPSRGQYDALRGGRRGGDRSMPNSDTISRRFGSWERALREANDR